MTDGPKAPARLKRRAEFLAVAKGRRQHLPTFTLQAARRDAAGVEGPRFGLTATRKVGGAVERNRMRRRLREALRRLPEGAARPDHDYVVVLRQDALSAPFDRLTADLEHALRAIHAPRGERPGRRARDTSGAPAAPTDAQSETRSNP